VRGADAQAVADKLPAPHASGEQEKDPAFDAKRTMGHDDDPPLLLAGDGITDLVVERLLARGGIGEIYVAKNPVLDKLFALKVLSRRFQKRVDVCERMQAEARALAQFPDHDGIVKVFTAGVDPRFGPYIVMELLKGQTLRSMLNVHGAFGIARAVAIAILIATITDDLHARLDCASRSQARKCVRRARPGGRLSPGDLGSRLHQGALQRQDH